MLLLKTVWVDTWRMGRESNMYLLSFCYVPYTNFCDLHVASQLILRRAVGHIYMSPSTHKNTKIKQLLLLLQSHIASRWLRWDSYQIWLNSKSLLISPLHGMCSWLSIIWELKADMCESSVSTYVHWYQASRVRNVICVPTNMPSIHTALLSSKMYHPLRHLIAYLHCSLCLDCLLPTYSHPPTIFTNKNFHILQKMLSFLKNLISRFLRIKGFLPSFSK